jgi:hypothetical protein
MDKLQYFKFQDLIISCKSSEDIEKIREALQQIPKNEYKTSLEMTLVHKELSLSDNQQK